MVCMFVSVLLFWAGFIACLFAFGLEMLHMLLGCLWLFVGLDFDWSFYCVVC